MVDIDLHIIPRGRKWAVRSGDSQRDNSAYDTQEQALQVAQEQAIRSNGSIIIYAVDGSVLMGHIFPRDSSETHDGHGQAPS